MSIRACKCGEPLPDDKRVKQCAACRGKAVRAQELARSGTKLAKWQAGIWWLYLANTIRIRLFADAGGRDPEPHEIEAAAKGAGMRLATFLDVRDGQPIEPRAFRRLCAWLGQPPESFNHDAIRTATRAQEEAA